MDDPDKRRGAPHTSDRLRDEIDRGGTGDKVAFSDPAAAPLGTDDEAAGHPPTPEQLRMAARHETRRAEPAEEKKTPANLQAGARPWGWILLAVAVLAALAAGLVSLSG